MAEKDREGIMVWQAWIILGFFTIAAVCVIMQTVRVFLWKDRYNTLVKTLKLGETIYGKTEENSNSRGNTEENDQ